LSYQLQIRRMKRILTLALTILCINSSAQNARIEGTISQIDSTRTLSGVSIFLDKSNLGAITNGNGYYSIDNIPDGDYFLTVSSLGFLTIKKEIHLQKGEALTLNFVMVESISVLPEVTFTVKGNTGIKDIPGSVYYISPQEIQKFSYTDINRTLRSVPGINMQEEDGFGLRPNIGLRGTGVDRSSKITVMEDGVLMAPAPYAAPAAYYFPTIGRMQAVEILKGSSQIKYGPYTTGGAINLISTQIPDKFSGRINLLGGSFGSRNLHAFVGNSEKNFAYIIETFQYGSNGFKVLDNGGNTGFDKSDYLAKFRLNTNDSAKIYQSLTFKVGQTTETSNETYLGLTEDDFNVNPYRRYSASQSDQMNSKQTQFSLTHLIKISNSFNITTTAYRSDFSRNWYKLDKVKDSTGTKTKIGSVLSDPTAFNDAYDILTGSSSSSSDALFVKANNRSYYAQGAQTVFKFNFNTKKITHGIDIGIRIHQDQIDRFQWVDEYAMDNGVMELTNAGVQGTESNRIETANAVASYIQYKFKIGKFTAIPGLRYENIFLMREDYGKNDPGRSGIELSKRSNSVDVFIPGIGLDYQFNKYLSTFAGVHKGFSPPGSKDETEPEESINYEVGVRYAKNSLSFETVLFYNDYNNLLGTDLEATGGNGTNDLFNGGEVQTTGVEFQFAYDLLTFKKKSKFSLPVSVVYTYTDAKFMNNFDSEFEGWGTVAAGDRFPYLANNQFTLIMGLEHRKFSVNVSGRYMDKMRTIPGQGEIPTNEMIDSYFVLDASATYVLQKNISLFVNATNITNQVYIVARRPAGLRPGMPRAFNAGIKATF
jgi:Fe(3+) dicitrate transport protein